MDIIGRVTIEELVAELPRIVREYHRRGIAAREIMLVDSEGYALATIMPTELSEVLKSLVADAGKDEELELARLVAASEVEAVDEALRQLGCSDDPASPADPRPRCRGRRRRRRASSRFL